MCGRFSLARNAAALTEFFPEFNPIGLIAPRYNIAPGQPLLAVLNDGRAAMNLLQWGLIPPWAKDPAIGNRMINARAETLFEKPSFKTPVRRKRCLVPADGFYEWMPRPAPHKKQPMHIRRKDRAPFMFAGLWEEWHDRDGGLVMTGAIITTRANALMAPIHERMPVILDRAHWDTWLSREIDRPEALQPLFEPCPPETWEAVPVSSRVNHVRIDDPACLEAVSLHREDQLELF